jgi:hypothetical protein
VKNCKRRKYEGKFIALILTARGPSLDMDVTGRANLR